MIITDRKVEKEKDAIEKREKNQKESDEEGAHEPLKTKSQLVGEEKFISNTPPPKGEAISSHTNKK